MNTSSGVAIRPPNSEYLTFEEAVAYCRVGKRTFQRWLNDGLVPFYRPAGGRRIYFRKKDLDEFFEAGRFDPRQKPRSSIEPSRMIASLSTKPVSRQSMK